MKLKTLSLCRKFLSYLRMGAFIGPKYAKIGDLTLTFSLLNSSQFPPECKLTYAYLFSHRHDVTGCRIPVLCENLSMTAGQIHSALKELENKKHIKLISAMRNDDLSIFAYYYEIVNPAKYGMLDLERQLCPIFFPESENNH